MRQPLLSRCATERAEEYLQGDSEEHARPPEQECVPFLSAPIASVMQDRGLVGNGDAFFARGDLDSPRKHLSPGPIRIVNAAIKIVRVRLPATEIGGGGNLGREPLGNRSVQTRTSFPLPIPGPLWSPMLTEFTPLGSPKELPFRVAYSLADHASLEPEIVMYPRTTFYPLVGRENRSWKCVHFMV